MGSCRRSFAFALTLGMLALTGTAQAASVTYTFTAEISDVEGSVPFFLGQTVTGMITYSDSLSVKSSTPTRVVYNGMGMLSFSVEGIGPSGAMDELVIYDTDPVLGDVFKIRSSAFLDTSEFVLRREDGDAFSGFSIPLMLASLDFEDAEFTLDLAGPGSVGGVVTSLTVVPEPATAALLALGLFGLGMAGRRP